MRFPIAIAFIAASLGTASPVLADDISGQIESARSAYAKNDPLHALSALQAAVNTLNARLSEQFGKALPPAPAGWEAGQSASQSLDTVGGGLTVTRAYTKQDSTLNAGLVVDNPAVGAAVTMFQNSAQLVTQPGWSRIKIGGDDALLRFDPASHSGEITMIVADRVLLQIEGNDIPKDESLVEAAKGWNIAAIRKLLGG